MSQRADLIITPRYILSNIVCNRIYDGVVILPYGLKLWTEYIHEWGVCYTFACVYVLRMHVLVRCGFSSLKKVKHVNISRNLSGS